MLRARHRRRSSAILLSEERPRLWIRFGIGLLVLLIVWYLGSSLIGIFRDGALERESARLTTEGDNIRVSLQGGEELRAQDGLKMYEGDTVSTLYGGNATLTFFDGTRVRLDNKTKIVIESNKKIVSGTSAIGISVEEGRVWLETGPVTVFTGSIVRSVDLGVAQVDLPAATTGLLSKDEIFFVSSEGLGAGITLALEGKGNQAFYLGEGQSFALTQEARTALEAGKDPYAFRDPINATLLADAFVSASQRAFQSQPIDMGMPVASGSGGNIDEEILVVTTPANNAEVTTETVTVAGRVSPRVQSLEVNGYPVSISTDGSFTQDLALPNEDQVLLRVEASDAAGITLAEASRTVLRRRTPLAAPTITDPGSSGAVVTITTPDVEIRGRAPARAAGIIVNDYRLQLFKAGDTTWSYLASTNLKNLLPGENLFTIYAVDSAGTKSAPATITIVVGDGTTPTPATGTGGSAASETPVLNNAPLTPGTLTVTAPTAGTAHDTSDVEILIEGKTSTATHSIWVNDYRLQLYTPGKDFWNYIASVDYKTLKPGKNTYRVVARNEKGEVLDKLEYTITYTPK